MRDPDRPGPDFLIVGSARSGTTLLQRLACELPDVAMPPETHFFDVFCRQVLLRGKPPFDRKRLTSEVHEWTQLKQVRGIELDVDAVVTRLGGRCDSLVDLFDAIVSELAPYGTILGEKTPNHLFWWRRIATARPELRIIATVRDPRSVVASNLAAPWAKEIVHPRWGDQAYVAMAERCRLEQEQVLAMATELGPRCLVLRYEDTVIDPAAARAAVAELLQVNELVASQAQALQRHHDIVLPWETWKTGAMDHVHADRVTTWRTELGAHRGRVVAAICADVMNLFGYPTSTTERAAATAAAMSLGPLTQRRRMAYRRGIRGDLDWINEVVL